MSGNQSWVTYASDEHEALKAVILVRSLKRVLSRRSSIVFLSHKVSEDIGSLLEDEFDRCVRLTDKKCQRFTSLSFGMISLIHSWNLTRLNKFVFLDCNCVVTKNSDELFKSIGVCPLNGKRNIDTRIPLVVDRPSETFFNKIVSQYSDENDNIGKNKSWNLDEYPLLDRKYNIGMNLRGQPLTLNINEIKILQFADLHPIEIFTNHIDEEYKDSDIGIFEKEAVSLFFDLFTANGLPKKISEFIEVHQEVITNYSNRRKNEIGFSSMSLQPLEKLKDSVAIVGMSFRFPGANNVNEFWDLLINGRDGIIKVPDDRWTDEHCFGKSETCKETRAGFLKCPIDEIDGKFFGLSPAELSYMDPQHRLTLQVTWEALEHSGINPVSLKHSNTGVFGGLWRSDYKEMIQDMGIGEDSFFRVYMGNSIGNLAGRVSHVLDITGPCIATESGCSTSIVSVDQACKSLLNDTCDLGLAFGVNLFLHPFSVKSMNTVVALDGHCKTFDAKADGFGRAEGCAVLVLKRFPDAMMDGDRIWGLIRGSAVVQEGPSRSMGTPTKMCEARAMELALENAGVEPKDVSFIETHGTGTPVGDPLEVAAMAEVYSKGRTDILTIGSVKTNIGHTESCSGIAGIIKTILTLQNEIIPPHRNFEKLNPEINLDTIPARIPLEPYKWEKNPNGKPRIAGVSSFGITGTDAHVIIQETPDCPPQPLNLTAMQPLSILKLTAKSQESLDNLLESYKEFLSVTDETVQDICKTNNVGRGDFQHRSVIVGTDTEDLLQKLIKNSIETKQTASTAPKICFLFTGQGSQYPGMAKTLYDHCPTFQMHFDSCDRLLKKDFGIRIKKALWGDDSAELSRTIYSQTSIFCVEYCLLKVWESWGVKPDAVLGHSLGEFAAAVAAGILTFEDALTLVAERSLLIDSLPRGKMLVIKENEKKVDLLLKSAFKGTENWLDSAAVNSFDQTVLAGTETNVREFSEFCASNKIKTHILDATHAFHSRQMDSILTEYFEVASSLSYLPQTCTFISGMEGNRMMDGEVHANYWLQHTRKGVQFMKASKTVLEEGYTLFLEVGPHPVLSALTMINSDGFSTPEPIICFPSLRKNEDGWSTILSTLGKLYVNGVDINWENVHQFSRGKKVTLPFYPFQNKPHWIESIDDRLRPIHSLVGTPLSSPSSLKMFENHIDLSRLPFLKDHAIGSKIIYPGAGFLEMCLVAGHSAIQCSEGGFFIPNAPLTIEDFLIEGPLGLMEDEKTQVQTIVSAEDTGETRVTIYSKMSLDKVTHKWIRHASGLFLPYAIKLNDATLKNVGTLEDIKSRCHEKMVTDKTYDEILKYGLKFGPAFQTMKNAWKGEGEFYCEIAVTQTSEGYICHPVVIDAMFQAMVFVSGTEINSLHVPISVSKFIWYNKVETDVCYVYGSRGTGGSTDDQTSVLFDSNGQLIAIMVGATLIKTTASTIMSTLEAQRTSLPTTYEEIWREQLGPLERRLPAILIGEKVYSESFKETARHFNTLSDDEQVTYEKSNKLYLMYMLNALYDLGWIPAIGQTFKIKDLTLLLNVQLKHMGMLRYVLMELTNEGYLKICDWERDTMSFKVVKQPPSREEVLSLIESTYISFNSKEKVEIDAVSAIGRVLGLILSGRIDPLPILFPDSLAGSQEGPAETIYKRSQFNISFQRLADFTTPHAMEGLVIYAQNSTVKPVLRILEVGSGTGAGTENLLRSLPGHPSLYEYTFTDISPAFVLKGEKLFENSKMKMIFKTLNIELDPLAQGFVPHHYDFIFASEVVHATKDVKESLSNLRNLLSPSGTLVITESVKPYRGVNITFGVLEGFWRFTDYDLRPYHCEMGAEKWEAVLRDLDFCETVCHKTYNSHHATIFARASPTLPSPFLQLAPKVTASTWMLFDNGEIGLPLAEKLKEMGKNVVFVNKTSKGYNRLSEFSFQIQTNELADMEHLFNDITQDEMKLEGIIYLWGMNHNNSDYATVCEPYLYLCKSLHTVSKLNLFVVTKGLLSIGDHDMILPSASPLLGMTKAFNNEHGFYIGCKCIDVDPKTLPVEEELQEIVAELFKDDGEFQVAYRDHRRHVCRFVTRKFHNNALSFPKSERFNLVLPSSNSIADLKFRIAQKLVLQDFEVEIRVKAYALNFRDLLIVLKPSSEFENWNTIGFDYAGVVTATGPKVTVHKVGDPVFGINFLGDALPSHMKANEDLVVPVPDRMTFADAATLPAVAATTYLCLVKKANLKEGETILIHTASGGVGLCAIQLAQALNCNIIATAGSHRKRAFLRNLGIKHVFHSRNTEYKNLIQEILGGPGVDVVLNSITGPGFKEATLSVCKPGARFIEMSVLNTWTTEEVKALRPDVLYEMVDLSTSSEAHLKEYVGHLKEFISSSSLNPIPYVRFDASEIRDALTYMQKAKHIGKIVCIMPETSINRTEQLEPETPMFNDRSTYLITGGLGGIGMEVAKWMASSGAKHIVLVGRSPPNAHVNEEIQKMNSKGGNIVYMKCDAGDYNQCRKLLETLKAKETSLPQLRGIMHAAGVLSDASFANQTWETYEKVYNSKVKGGWNLHQLTIDYPLEHFVMFSSVIANMGGVGQSNHSSANVFLDALAYYRHSIGLPSTTINWGQWGQVGVAASIEVVGLRPFTPLQGVSALETIMKSHQLQTTVLEADLRTLRTLNPSCRCYFQELKDESDEKTCKLTVSSEDFWAAFDTAETSEKKYDVVKKFIHSVIRHILKLDKDEQVEDHSNFQDIGMDSLMMIEMKNALQGALGTRAKISISSVKDCTTVAQLTTRIVELISGIEEVSPPTKDELNLLIREDSTLPSEIYPHGEACNPHDIRTVLITGVSGNLGPYVLRELSKRPHIQKIYCLMLPKSNLSAHERLLKTLTDKNLSSNIRLDIIECVIGNVSKKRFGLSDEAFAKLATEVDAVFHLAVKSNHLEIYRKARESDTDMRTVNVLGTQHILEFACESKSKHVYHASSILAVTKLGEDGRISENMPKVGDFDNLPNMGYPLSKFIGDLLLAEAVSRGLPCKIFRFPFIGGESKTGRNVDTLNSALMLRMMAYLQLGMMPAANIPFVMLPVDTCAEISVRIFFDDAAGNEMYNVSNPFANDETDIKHIAGEFDCSIDMLKPNDFFEQLEQVEDNELLHFIKGVSDDRTAWYQIEGNAPEPIVAWLTNRTDVFLSQKLKKLIPDYPNFMETSLEILKRDLQFAKTSGVFKKLGLKT